MLHSVAPLAPFFFSSLFCLATICCRQRILLVGARTEFAKHQNLYEQPVERKTSLLGRFLTPLCRQAVAMAWNLQRAETGALCGLGLLFFNSNKIETHGNKDCYDSKEKVTQKERTQ